MNNYYKAITRTIVLLMLFASVFSIDASPAYPGLINFTQPDGSSIRIYLKGNEKIKWAETEDGYSILFNAEGYYEYAITDINGDMTLSGIIAKNAESRNYSNFVFLSSTSKHKTYSQSQVLMAKQIWNMTNEEKNASRAFPTTGTRKLICILIGFTDKAFTKTQAEFNNLFNQINYSANGATGSVKDYFKEASYNQLNLSVDVFGPYTAANNMSYYGGNDANGNDSKPRELITEAINLADSGGANFVNYDNDNDGNVDGVYVIYAGYGEEAGGGANCIWAHAWGLYPAIIKDGKRISSYSCSCELQGNSGTTMTNIGVICHEFGHTLGAPDFYDTDYGTDGQYVGTGNWDLQAGGSWNNGGKTPPHPNAYTKCYIYNWATPTLLSAATTVTLNNSAQNASSFYRYNTTTANEYFLIENRQQLGFDAFVPGKGLLVYHIDGDFTSSHLNSNDINNTSHQGMYIVPATSTSANGIEVSASSKVNTTGCPYPGTGNKTSFSDVTTPNSKSWANANTAKPLTSITENTTNKTITLNFMGGSSCTPPSIQAKNFSATALADNSMTVNWIRGNGNAVMVVARAGSAVDNSPFNGVAYTGNASYGSGNEVGTGNFVVYKGTANSVNLTNLVAGTTYHFAIYELTTATNCYKTLGLTGNATTTGTPPCNFCIPTANSNDLTGITNVSFNTISNSSNSTDAYTNYAETISTTLTIGQIYPLSVNVNTSGNYSVNTKAWIDWNQDCIFDPITEEYNLGNANNDTNGLTSDSPLSIIVPEFALTGNTKMRIRTVYYYNESPLTNACGNQNYSEAEDYTINVEPDICIPVAITSQPIASQSTCVPGGASFMVATTGTAPITYQWQYYNGSTWNNVANGTPAGANYTNATSASLTVTSITNASTYQYRCYLTNCNENKNATSNTASLVVNALPTAGITNNSGGTTEINCTNPTINVTATGGSSYVWSGGTTPNTAANSFTNNGTYTVTVTASNGCTASSSIGITKNITTPTAGITNNSGGATEINCTNPTINVTATGGISYVWSGGNTPNTATNSFINSGTYTVTVTAANGCMATSSILITKNVVAPSVGITNNSSGATEITCATPAINVTATGGTSYVWSGGTTPNTGANSFINNGLYTVTVTAANGCIATSSISITKNVAVPTAGITNNTGITQVSCTTPAINVTATGGISYVWSGGTTPNTGANSFINNGLYTVTVTAANGCIATSSISITKNVAVPTAGITNNTGITQVSCTTPAINVTATGGISYVWSGGTTPNTGANSFINNGLYTVTVTAANGCIATSSISITKDITVPSAEITNNSGGATEITCATPSINVTATGGTSYVWSGGTTPNTGANSFINSGTYTVTVTAANGCSATSSISITEDMTVPSVGITNNSGGATAITCATPAINVTATGGISYAWSGGITPNTATNSFTNSGIYTVAVTAANGCSATSSIFITKNVAVPTAGITNNTGITQVSCTTPAINITATGGTSYVWSGGTTLNTATNNLINGGSYTVTVIGENGCSATSSIIITENTTPPTAGITNNSGCATEINCTNPTISVTATGGTSYIWSGGMTPNTAENSFTNGGTYNVTVSAVNGCSATSSIIITENTTPPAVGITNNSSGATEITCATPAINVTATGGISYAWSGGMTPNTAENSFNNANTYTVTVTSENGCTESTSIVITQTASVVNAAIINNSNGETEITCTLPNISVTATGGTSYIWSGGTTPNTAENSFTDGGTYTVTVSNDSGCTSTSMIAITQDILTPIISISSNSPICAGEELLLSANNGISYSWSGPNGFSSSFENPSIVDATSAETGEYSVTVTGANGCTSSEQTSAVVNAVIAHFSHMTNGLTVSFSNNSIDATSYTWDFSGMGSSNLENPEFTFPSDGVYSVSLVATNGNCSDSSSQQITLTNVGIATNDLNIFNIYPNPASKTLTVQVSAEAINKTLSIYDVTGRLVFQKQVESLQEELNISNLVTGVYEIQINTDPKKLHKRLMVN